MTRTIFYTFCFFAFLLCGLVSSVNAQDKTQDYEYGKFEDLKGLKTVYIDTRGNIKDRNEIIQEFEKAKLDLVIVDERESADIIINFQSSENTQAVSRTLQNTYDPKYNVNVVSRVKLISGDAMVTIKGKSKDKPRVIMNFNGGRRNPAEKFAKEFVKLYQKLS
jgi:hypothetical protein